MHDESVYAEQALRAGAFGYVVKQEASQNVVKAIREALKGERYVSGRIGSDILQRIV
jgi:DNA-binding NarL/FixJ family response regulator